MLDMDVVRKIENFVYVKPRSVQEIALHLKKNWRTVDRYVEEIIKEYGTVDKRIFREGTRGALKIIYWASVERVSRSIFQEELEREIFNRICPADFSAFDIFQHAEDRKKEVWTGEGKNEVDANRLEAFAQLLRRAKKQVLFFSGNLSFINFEDSETNIFSVIEELVKRDISIKVLCKVDVSGKKNIEKLLALNHKYGKELIEIRHRKQPLRVSVIDGKILNMKEIYVPNDRKGELEKRLFLFYSIYDKDWGEWMSRIFWKMFSNSIGSEKRLGELKKILNN
jgi:hypothetical protein